MTPRIEIILASIREGRMGEKVARWIHALAAHRTELEVGLIDLRDWPLPPYAYPATPRVMESRYPDPLARAWVGRIGGADGFIIVTPEYNHGYPPSLKNAIDYVYAGWNFKPAAFVSYGGPAGGVRAVEQLRLVAIELQMVPVRGEVNLPFIGRALNPQGEPTDPFHAERAAAMFDQLAWWAQVLREGRERHAPPALAPPAPAPAGAARSPGAAGPAAR